MTFAKTDMKHSEPIMDEENEEKDAESVHGLGIGIVRVAAGEVDSTGRGFWMMRFCKSRRRCRTPPPTPESKGIPGWDYFFPPMENVLGPSLAEVDESRIKGEEIERKVMEEREQKREVYAGDEGRKSTGKIEADEMVEKELELPPQLSQPAKAVKKVKQVVLAEGKRKGGSNVNLLQIVAELDDCFLKASESAHDV